MVTTKSVDYMAGFMECMYDELETFYGFLLQEGFRVKICGLQGAKTLSQSHRLT